MSHLFGKTSAAIAQKHSKNSFVDRFFDVNKEFLRQVKTLNDRSPIPCVSVEVTIKIMG